MNKSTHSALQPRQKKGQPRTSTDPRSVPRKPRARTKKPVGLKLSFLGVNLLECMSKRHAETPLQEDKGPIVDRLLLQEAITLRHVDAGIEDILSKAGL